MTDHGARDHATWSASASERLWACPGSMALSAGLPDKESEAAAWGTACHQISEKCLRSGKDAVDFIGSTETTKEHSFEVDDEMAETAQVYIDYVRGAVDAHGKRALLIEQKFSLAAIKPPFDAGGTGDAVILSPEAGLIEIVDLKGGRGVVVEAVGNKQLRTYALGALLANPGPWRRVRVTIVQPRAPHPDGRIRSEDFHVTDLMDWTTDLLEAMHKADAACEDYAGQGGPVLDDYFLSRFLKAGEHCTFCKAKPTCPALQQKALEVAQTFFQPEGAMKAPPPPASLGMEKLVAILDHADMLSNWLNAVRAYAQDQAEAGVEITNGTSTYVLTPKQARRKWNVEDPITAISTRLNRDPDDFYQAPKPMTPPMVEKVLGKKGFEAVKDLVVSESSGLNLTRSDKTTRGAVVPPVKQFFQPI